MRLATLLVIIGLALSSTNAQSQANRPEIDQAPSVIAMEVPGTQYRQHPDPTFPERSQDSSPTWDDTADTSDELRSETETSDEILEIKPEKDLNNQVHDPLLESPLEKPEEAQPIEDFHEPIMDPIPR